MYNRLRLICFFDLPMVSKVELRRYRVFRKRLIELGFVMIQESVYVRTLPNRSQLKKYEDQLKKVTPYNGLVELMYVSEKQFNDRCFLAGEKAPQEVAVGNNKMVII
ncbi:CRISPR-associated endonuclease Cas2 [Liquorilactobacillus mali]|uniref:CRISPR-associated endonuclease Cas2 n=1 Tax=Liquorilactobacillus mali TaxID=1618 RepID=UPI000AE3AD00|nr:CRISPR-associated endonuclease Cas2 [Liquorilactobacillus mali]MDN7146506.1 CRISPR-associated endonuclease Cas2 [Liquorilactobacillus mali]